MLGSLRDAWYLPNLKAKLGECTALKTVRVPVRAGMTPICITPPAGYDHELGRYLRPLEHLQQFGKRLAGWGGGFVFVDATRVDDAKHRSAVETHPLTELLERARLHGAQACPVIPLTPSAEYEAAVKRFALFEERFPVCLRLSAGDLETKTLTRDIDQLLMRIGVVRERVAVLFDFQHIVFPPEPAALDAFTDLLIDRINRFAGLHEWLTIAVAVTSFPQEFKKLKAGDIGRYPRTDWAIYRALFAEQHRLLRMPAYSDYAVENLEFPVLGPASPTAQFRYTAIKEYLLIKGPSTKIEGYEAIFDVAKRVVALPEFKGPTFSDGNAYIANLALALEGTGNAAMWRWASTDHHLTFVMSSLAALKDVAFQTTLRPEPDQFMLFDSTR